LPASFVVERAEHVHALDVDVGGERQAEQDDPDRPAGVAQLGPDVVAGPLGVDEQP
jgi:hypothetical protein